MHGSYRRNSHHRRFVEGVRRRFHSRRSSVCALDCGGRQRRPRPLVRNYSRLYSRGWARMSFMRCPQAKARSRQSAAANRRTPTGGDADAPAIRLGSCQLVTGWIGRAATQCCHSWPWQPPINVDAENASSIVAAEKRRDPTARGLAWKDRGEFALRLMSLSLKMSLEIKSVAAHRRWKRIPAVGADFSCSSPNRQSQIPRSFDRS